MENLGRRPSPRKRPPSVNIFGLAKAGGRGYPGPVAEGDPFQRWLDDYRQGVDETLSRSETPRSPLARDAQEAFQTWWRAEQDDLLSPQAAASRLGDPELTRADQDHLLPPDWPAQVERLAFEKAEADRRAMVARAQTAAAEKRAGELERALVEQKTQASRERSQLETRLAKLEQDFAVAGEKEKTLREARDLMQDSATRVAQEAARLQKELALEREKGELASRQGAMLAGQVAELEKERARLRETIAAQDGALEELRKQAASYQQRFIEAKELTDADIALMRQDLKLFMEELKIIRNTIKKGE